MGKQAKEVDLLQGTLDLMVLKAVSLGPLHGYGVLLRIEQISGNRLEIPQGSLYPALYRLEHEGWIASEWGQSENNRKAKYYRLTAAGRKRLRVETEKWNHMADAIGAILSAAPEENMRLLRRIATWWKAVLHSDELNAEIEDELAFHLDAYAEDLMSRGVERGEAYRRARAEFGGVAAQKENCRAAWGTRLWDELRGDLRYALRGLKKSPGFTAIAIGSLALGLGANTIVFTATKAMLLDRLGVPRPGELRLFELVQGAKGIVHGSWGWYDEGPSGEVRMTSFTYPIYRQLRERNRVLEDVFAFKNYGRMTATIDNKAEAVTTEMVSGNYYRDLEVQPVLGRAIADADDAAVGSGPVVVISYGFWSRRFGRSAEVIGRKIELNSTPVTVIGVNPPTFTGAYAVQDSPDVFLPFSMQPIVAPQHGASLLTDRNLFWVVMMGRLKQGVSTQAAQAEMNVELDAAIRATMTVDKGDEIPRLLLEDGSRGQNEIGGDFAKPMYMLTALAGFVLLLACANLGNLLLARASSRQRGR